MAGTRAGGLKCRDTNYNKQGADFYKLIGAKGGKRTVKKGFGSNAALAREAGRKGAMKRWSKHYDTI